MGADGSIIIDTEIRTDGIENGSKEINDAMQGMSKTASKCAVDIREFMESFGKGGHTNELRQELEAARDALKDLEAQGFYFGDEEYDSAYLKLKRLEAAAKDYQKELTNPTPDANPFGIDTLEGKVVDLELQLQKAREAGKSLGDADYDALIQKLAIAKENARDYAKELAKTPKMIEEENQKRAAAQAREEAAAARAQARLDAQIAKEEQLLQTQLAKEAQAAMEAERLAAIANAAEVGNVAIIEMRQELEKLIARQKELERAGLGAGYAEYDQNTAKIAEMRAKIDDYTRSLRKAKDEAKELPKAIEQAKKQSSGLGLNLKNVLKYAFGIRSMFVLVNKFRAAVVAGFKNMAQFSPGVNESISMMVSALSQLKNALATAFAPILTVVAPLVTTLINLISQASTAIAQFMAMLTGKGTFIAAKKINEDYAKSLKGAGGAAKQAGKDAERGLAGFDKLNVIAKNGSDAGGGGGGGATAAADMFEVQQISSMMQSLRAELDRFLGSINFGPMIAAWNNLKAAVQPLFELLISAGGWIVKNVIEPFARWTIEEAVPRVLDLIASAVEVLTEFLKALKPLWDWFWENVLAPVGKAIGQAVLKALDLLNQKLKDLADWMRKNPEKVQTFVVIVGALAAGFVLVTQVVPAIMAGFTTLMGGIATLKAGFLAAIEIISGPVGIVLAIAAIAAICITTQGQLGEFAEAIKQIFKGLAEFISGVFTGDWTRAWEGVKLAFSGIMNGIIIAAEAMVNTVVDCLNKLSVDIPDWIPEVGGAHFGFNLQHVSLPRLASGTVVPPRAGEFAAILGDNKRETEVVSPLSTIRQALIEALQSSGAGGDIRLVVNLDGRQIYETVVDRNRRTTKTTGRNPLLV